MSSLLILGASGHGRVVADAALCAEDWTSVTGTDRDPSRCSGELIPGVALLGLGEAMALGAAVHVAIGNAVSREREVLALAGAELASVVHPRASVSPRSQVAAGCFIAAQALVAPGVRLQRCVIVNHGAIIDHDVSVGEFSHIAPRAGLGGGVRIGRRVLIGSGATVLPGVNIGDDVVVGAGAVVCADVPLPGVYVGVPARKLK